MTGELAAYESAINAGTLIKNVPNGPSKAKQIWEAAYGPVPPGFHVDHIVQRQFGGTDDLWNLQLKLGPLNMSEGSRARWLNIEFPYGTQFNGVILEP